MKEHPILFKPEMVRAILEGRKTQTRRIATKDTSTKYFYWVENDFHIFPEVWKGKKAEPYTGWVKKCGSPLDIPIKCPYGLPGDRLWVRETFQGPILCAGSGDLVERIFYRATDERRINHKGQPIKWKPSIHMPRWASRILLEITNVRVERVQDISVEDAEAEGFRSTTDNTPGPEIPLGNGYTIQQCGESIRADGHFALLWDSLNEKSGYGWDVNPWVWVIEFKDIKRE